MDHVGNRRRRLEFEGKSSGSNVKGVVVNRLWRVDSGFRLEFEFDLGCRLEFEFDRGCRLEFEKGIGKSFKVEL